MNAEILRIKWAQSQAHGPSRFSGEQPSGQTRQERRRLERERQPQALSLQRLFGGRDVSQLADCSQANRFSGFGDWDQASQFSGSGRARQST